MIYCRFLILAPFILVAACCSEKPVTDPLADKQVLIEIFPALVDSMYIIAETSMMPPIPPRADGIPYTTAELEDQANKEAASIRSRLTSYKNMAGTVPVFINGCIVPIRPYHVESSTAYLGAVDSSQFKSAMKLSYATDLKALKVSSIFKLTLFDPKSKAHLADMRSAWGWMVISVSRISLNKQGTKGVLNCEISPDRFTGIGYDIYIKRINNHWIIDRITRGWIACG